MSNLYGREAAALHALRVLVTRPHATDGLMPPVFPRARTARGAWCMMRWGGGGGVKSPTSEESEPRIKEGRDVSS